MKRFTPQSTRSQFREGGLGAAPGQAEFTGSDARRVGLAATGATRGETTLATRSVARSMAWRDPFGIRCSSRSRQSSAETGSALRGQAATRHLAVASVWWPLRDLLAAIRGNLSLVGIRY